MYKKPRENHPDAQKNFYAKLGGHATALPGAVLTSTTAHVVKQPGDGSCLFHSMSYGLHDGSSAGSLRAEKCRFIERNGSLVVSGNPLAHWIQWDSNTSCAGYAVLRDTPSKRYKTCAHTLTNIWR